MLPERKSPDAASILRAPTLAVIAAYSVRMLLLWASQHHQVARSPFEPVGLEEGMVALSLAKGKGFFGPFPGYDALTAWLAPVYPFLWAVFYKIFRVNSEGLLLVGQTMNCAFAAATCWPIFSIGKRLFGEKIGLAAAWTWVFLPYGILMPLEWVWDQSLAALVLALLVDVTMRLRESSAPLHWSGYGLLWGFAALVNPALCALLPFALAWLMLQRSRSGTSFSPALYARVALLFVLSVLPWTIRNYYVADGWVFVKSNFGLELWIGNHPGANRSEDLQKMHPAYNVSELFRLVMSGEANYSRGKEQLAIAYIKANPREFLRKSWGRFIDTWSAREDSRNDTWLQALQLSRENVWLCSAFSLLSFAGVILALLETGWQCVPAALCLVVFPIPYYLTHTALRYRHPIDPLMTIFAVCALAHFWKTVSSRLTVNKLEPTPA